MSQPLELTFNFLTAGIVVELNQYFDTSAANLTGYQVNWGDGNSDTTFVHTYNAAGTYKISISATTLIHFGLNIVSPNTTIQYLTAVNSWGTLPIEDFSNAFYAASALVSVPNTLPDSARNLEAMFLGCSALNNPNIQAWDVSQVISLSRMFFNCASFNKPLNNWNIGQCLHMSNMFEYTSMSAINYSATLAGWAAQIPYVQANVIVGALGLTYNPAGAAAREALSASPYNWIFDGDLAETPAPLILLFYFRGSSVLDLNQYFDTSEANLTGFQVNWGITNSHPMDTLFRKVYPYAGSRQVRISATTLVHFGTDNTNNITIQDLVEVHSWGTIPIQSFRFAFKGAVRLGAVPETLPDSARDLGFMFAGCTRLYQVTGRFINWNVSQVTHFDSMFLNSNFNRPLNNWNIGQGVNMTSMFDNCMMTIDNYSATLVGWAAQKPRVQTGVNVGAAGLFYNPAGAAARSLLAAAPSLWTFSGDTPAPLPMELTFDFPTVGIILDLSQYFDTSSTNIKDFQVNWGDGDSNNSFTHTYYAAVTYKISIFATTLILFGSSYGSLNITIQYLTAVNSWGSLPIQSFSYAFLRATALVSVPTTLPDSARNLTFMFADCSLLNDPNISNWNVSQVARFDTMFSNCTEFNQPLNNWNIGQGLNMANMFDNCNTMSTANYSATLVGWAAQKSESGVQTDVNVGAEGLFYNEAGAAARSLLAADPSFWTFSGDLAAQLPMELTFDFPPNTTLDLRQYFDTSAANLTGYQVNWGDGNSDTTFVHTYNDEGLYTVSISATTLVHFGVTYNPPAAIQYLTAVNSWGDLPIEDFSYAFTGAVNLVSVPATLPNSARNVSLMFFSCTALNDSNISAWDVSQVTSISSIFNGCTNFNQPLNSWNVGTITNLNGMFYNCTNFNKLLNDWNVGNVTMMNAMFDGCASFNQHLNNWNVSKVTGMNGMFNNCSSFDQTLNSWDVDQVMDMYFMFANCGNFNQPLNNWDVSQVTQFGSMFINCTKFNQPLNNWNIGQGLNMANMFDNCNTMSTANYSATLVGWAAQKPNVQTGVNVGAEGLFYNEAGAVARSLLAAAPSLWTFSGDMAAPLPAKLPMILEYTSSVPFTLTLPLDFDFFGPDNIAANLTIDWGDGTIDTNISISLPTHTFAAAGTFQVKIYADYVRVYGFLNYLQGREYLTTVVQWGELQTVAFFGTFQGATNLTGVPAALPTDIDGSPQILSTYAMFYECSSFNQNINGWNVESVSSFVNDDDSFSMGLMFSGCTNFNQPLNDWDVGNVLSMYKMFSGCTSFNQPLNDWDVGNVLSMFKMFEDCTIFNQPLNDWDVKNVTLMLFMFYGCTKFNQPLNNWDVSKVIYMYEMFTLSGLRPTNYSNMLRSWATLPLLQSDVNLSNGPAYNALAVSARSTLTGSKGWTIEDGGLNEALPMILEFTSTVPFTLSVPLDFDFFGPDNIAANLTIDWGDGTIDTNISISLPTHTFAAAGTFQVKIYADYVRVYGFLNYLQGREYLTTVVQWGELQTVAFFGAFAGATILTSVPAALPTDIDGSPQIVSTYAMFYECSSFNQNINGWNVESVSSFVNDDDSFSMGGMFSGCTNFNQPLNDWDVKNTTNMVFMFYGCTKFNQPLNDWDVSKVIDMYRMFDLSGLRPTNYSNILHGWAALPLLQSGVNLSVGPAYNALAVSARSTLTGSKGWFIEDGGLNEALPMILEYTSTVPFTLSLPLDFNFFGLDNIAANLTIDWGDSTIDSNTSHTYALAGIFQVKMYADYVRVYGVLSFFGPSQGMEYLTSVIQFGELQTVSFIQAFQGAFNLTSVPTALPTDINGNSQIGTAFAMFANCSKFNQPLNDWDVSLVNNMGDMFSGCTIFNQPLNNWNIREVTVMERMFDNCNMSADNYSATLVGWAAQKPNVQANVIVGAEGLTYNPAGAAARSLLAAAPSLWTFSGDEAVPLPAKLPMILEYTSSVPFTLTLPLDFDFFGPDNIAANLTIDWGDGTIDTNISISLPTHTYAAAGTFQVKIYADYVRVYGVLNLLQGREYLTKVVQWGELQTVAFIAAFQGATNLTGVPAALPTDIDGSPQILSTFGMFANCANFNQNINSWNVESVSSFVNNGTSYSMEFMFYGCTSFDQPLNDWDVGNVLIMIGMFDTCTIFNQPLNDWDVKNVTLMVFMFYGCTKFNQPLNNWDVSKVINMYGMFTLSGLRPTNYSNMLRSWATLPLLQSDVNLSNGPAYNALAVSARSTLTGSNGWIIDDGGLNEALAMILEYTSDVSFTLTLPLDFESFDPDNIAANLTIEWDDGTVDTNISTSLPSHTYAGRANDAYEVKIYADYVRVYGFLDYLQGMNYLTRVLQFGELQTAAFIGAFFGATSLFSVPAALPTDIDGNPQIVSTFVMFANCRDFNQDISGWNVSQVVNMDGMFSGCTSFNRSLNDWIVTKVSNMAGMFYGCTSFNQPLNNWDVSLVNNMDIMFRECTKFNQSLNTWKVGNVTGMDGMFYECASFNQPLNDWDVGNVTRMNAMFYGCTDFNQPLNNWNVKNVTEMSGMFTFSGLRPTNYSNMLRGWAALPLLQSGVTLSVGPAYNALAVIPRSTLTGSKGWTISDGGLNEALPMILQFDSTTLPFTISLALSFTNFGVDNIAPNLTVEWGDGVVTNNAGPHTYTNGKNQQVNIYADYVRNFGSASTPTGIEYLTQVSQWGLLQTTGFTLGFSNAQNLLIVPNQLPMDINGSAQVTSTNSMFFKCKKMNSIFLKTWDVSAVTDMTNMFTSCTAFNQPLKTWDVSAVTLMINVFEGCTAFNQDLSSWNVENVTNLQALFSNCTNFQSDLGGWPVQNVLSFDSMFFNCKKFTADLSRWNVASATSMSGLFANSGMTAEDYSTTLIGWAAKPPLQANVQLGAQGVYYLSVATKARNFLTKAPYNWTIMDNGIAPLPLMPATFTQLQQVVYKFDIDIKTWTPAKTQQVITYSAYIFNVSAKQITATVKAGSVIVTLLIGSPPPPPAQPSWKCEYVCPPRVLPKPNAAFNGNTNILTTANTNAFRYSQLVSRRNRNGQSISLPNPLANALFGLNGAPPRNKF